MIAPFPRRLTLATAAAIVAGALSACSPPPPPLPGGPPPEYEPARSFALPGQTVAPAEAAPASASPPVDPSAAAVPAAAPGTPSTWTSTSVESPAPPIGSGTPIGADGRIGAKHLVVMYKGARRAPDAVTRTKTDAQKRAEVCLTKTKAPGAKFEAVVSECSDEPFGKERGGDLATFKPEAMDPAFTKALLDLEVGHTSGVVETPFGFHIILRTQ